MTQDKWQAWWEIVWLNLLHVFGIVAAVGVFLWLVWTFAGPIFLPPKEVRDQTTNERKATQAVFQRALMNVPKPCAVKGKPYSDVSGCSVFGLRLGMSLEDVKETLDGSGYFSDRTSLIKGCIERVPRCVGFVRQSNGDFSLTVYLMPAWEGDTTQLAIFDITLQIGPRTLPYFTPEHIRTTFAGLFGPSDKSIGEHDLWGGDLNDSGPNLSAYPYKGEFVVILTDQPRSEKK